jgi:hypothetical protein
VSAPRRQQWRGRTVRRTALACIVLLAALLPGGCVGSGAPTFVPRPDSSSASASAATILAPCGPAPSDWPAEKAAGLDAACHPTLPPLTGTPIPWLDSPYTGPQITPSPSVDLESAYVSCDLSQIRLAFEGWGTQDVLGSVGRVVARTTGARACLLHGLAKTELLDSRGTVLSTGEPGDGPLGPALLQPQLAPPDAVPSDALLPQFIPGYGYEEVRVSGFCGLASPAAALRVTLEGRTPVMLTVPPLPASGCSSGGNFVLDWPFLSEQSPQPKILPPSWLSAQAEFPAQATVGQAMHFIVALQNHEDLPVSLDPCPIYTLRYALIDAGDREVGETALEYTLNCAGIEQIGPQSTLGFEMQLTVPADTPLSDSLVVWWWLGTSDYTAGPEIKQPISLVAPKS